MRHPNGRTALGECLLHRTAAPLGRNADASKHRALHPTGSALCSPLSAPPPYALRPPPADIDQFTHSSPGRGSPCFAAFFPLTPGLGWADFSLPSAAGTITGLFCGKSLRYLPGPLGLGSISTPMKTPRRKYQAAASYNGRQVQRLQRLAERMAHLDQELARLEDLIQLRLPALGLELVSGPLPESLPRTRKARRPKPR